MSYKDPRDYEAQALTLDAHEKCFVREIMLINQDNRECLSHGRVCIRGDNQKAIDLLENLGEKYKADKLFKEIKQKGGYYSNQVK